jgi:glycine oxidase
MALNVAIIGSGIVGLACAQRLALEGCRVTTFDGNKESREASWAAAGMLAPHNEAQEPNELWQLCYASLKAWPNFIASIGVSSESLDFHLHGCAIPIFNDEEKLDLQAKIKNFMTAHIPFEWIDALECRRREPALSHELSGAYFVEGGHVDPRAVWQALRQQCSALGVNLFFDNAVSKFEGPNLWDSHGTLFHFDHLILAAGAWTPKLAELTGLKLAGVPVKGQMLRFTPHPITHLNGFVHCEHAYAVQRKDGSTVIGSTMEMKGFDRSDNPESIDKLIKGAHKICPHLKECELSETWTGLRPKLGDGSPYIKKVNQHLTVATGHFRNGILLTPITAEKVASCVLDE